MSVCVVVPLCDYEPIATRVWYRRTTHYIVRQCLRSFADHVRTPLDLYILPDRCTDAFVQMAEIELARFAPVTIDNSIVRADLAQTDLAEKTQHIANQLLKTFELAEHYDFVYFCEQDYLFKPNALASALTAFDEIPRVNLLSMFDHPDRHNPISEQEYGQHCYFPTSDGVWKSVSSTNGNFLWRMAFVRECYDWLETELLNGALDYRLTNGLYRQGELLLSPVESLIQHFRLDGTNASPTFGSCPQLERVRRVGRAVKWTRRWRRRLKLDRAPDEPIFEVHP